MHGELASSLGRITLLSPRGFSNIRRAHCRSGETEREVFLSERGVFLIFVRYTTCLVPHTQRGISKSLVVSYFGELITADSQSVIVEGRADI